MKLALFGYGGHAREVAAQMNEEITFFVDDKYTNEFSKPISTFDPEIYQMMVAVADSKEREKIVKKLPQNTSYFTFVHPTALLMSEDIQVGVGSFIGAYSILTTNITIGNHAILNRGNQIGHDSKIGDFFSAMPGAIVSGNVVIETNVYMGNNSSIREKITVGSNVIIGANAACVKNIITGGTYVGVPAKFKKNNTMNLKNDEGKLNFVINLHHEYARAMSGGIVALQTLAYKIAERGHNVYIFCKPEYPHENIHVIPSKSVYTEGFLEGYEWEPFNYPLNKTISILPQITRGNSFNTIHTARWILYDTEWEIEKDYGDNEVYFNYGNFKTFKDVPKNKLTVFNYYFDKLYQTNFGKRKGLCHIRHKHTPPNGEKIFEQLKSTSLNDWKTNGAYDFLREQLNQYEYFLTYDQKSFYTLAAGLCGCKSIILNPGPSYEFAPNAYSDSKEYVNEFSPTEYRLENPIQAFGVAYGWDDIGWANKTIDFVPNYLKELEKIDNKTVDGFIKYWENKIFTS